MLDKLLRPTLTSSLPPLIRLRQLASSLPVTRENTVSLLPVTVNPPEVVVRILDNIVSLAPLVEAAVKLFSDVILTDGTDDVTDNDVTGDDVIDVTNDAVDGDVVDDDIIVDDTEVDVDAFTVDETVTGDVVSTFGCEVELFTVL